MSGIDLAGFDAKFAGDADPWATFTAHDEATKRAAILHALGPGPWGRVLELASGAGSNSAAIAPRALRLDATEGTAAGTRLTARAIETCPRARANLISPHGRANWISPRARVNWISPRARVNWISPRARAVELALPARPPRACYDAIVVAELLYYLSPRDMARVARDMAAVLRPGGRLVLAHHRIDFYDFAQHAAHIHARFLRRTGRAWRCRVVRRTGAWIVLSASC